MTYMPVATTTVSASDTVTLTMLSKIIADGGNATLTSLLALLQANDGFVDETTLTTLTAAQVLQGSFRFILNGQPQVVSFATLLAAMQANLTFPSGGSTGGSTGGNTGGSTTPPPSGLPALTFTTAPTYGAAKFGNGLTAGAGSVPITTVANAYGGSDLQINAEMNWGSAAGSNADVFYFVVGGQKFGLTMTFGEIQVLQNGNSSHSGQNWLDSYARTVSFDFSTNGSGGTFRCWVDGNKFYETGIPYVAAGTVIPLYLDCSGMGPGRYIDDIEVLNSSSFSGTAPVVKSAAAVRGSLTNLILPLDGSGAGI